MRADVEAEAERQFSDALKSKGFRLVMRYGGSAYWKHRDGRSIQIGPNHRGELSAVTLAERTAAGTLRKGRQRRGL